MLPFCSFWFKIQLHSIYENWDFINFSALTTYTQIVIVTNKVQKQPPGVFYKKDVLKNFSKFTGKHLCWSLFFNKDAGLRPATLLKNRFQQRCFPVNFVKFLRTPFLKNTSWRLLLKVTKKTFGLTSWKPPASAKLDLSHYCLYISVLFQIQTNICLDRYQLKSVKNLFKIISNRYNPFEVSDLPKSAAFFRSHVMKG